jgi:hypothetical protein
MTDTVASLLEEAQNVYSYAAALLGDISERLDVAIVAQDDTDGSLEKNQRSILRLTSLLAKDSTTCAIRCDESMILHKKLEPKKYLRRATRSEATYLRRVK